MTPKALQVLIPSGIPNGMKVIELSGWTGKCFVVPRQSLKELKDRSEANQPGLYLLFGVDEGTSEELVYIGESENFLARITSHDAAKDFWNVAVIFTGGLNRALVKYLEFRATTLAHDVGRIRMENRVQPQENALSEFERVGAEQFFENVQFILATLNYSVFESVAESVIDTKMYYLKAEDTDARAQVLEDGSLNVFKGSLARIRETEAFLGWSLSARRRFLEDGTFVPHANGVSYELTRDVLFNSPSAAAATMTGRPINGWTSWKDEQGKTLDQNIRQ